MSNTFAKNNNKYLGDHTTLDKAELNETYVITDCLLPPKLQIRFAELGLIVGARVKVIKTAPLGDPLEISVMGYSLCVRANELKQFKAVKTDDE